MLPPQDRLDRSSKSTEEISDPRLSLGLKEWMAFTPAAQDNASEVSSDSTLGVGEAHSNARGITKAGLQMSFSPKM